jgi:hypothetical protein
MTSINIIIDQKIEIDGQYNKDYYINSKRVYDGRFISYKNYYRNGGRTVCDFYSRYFKLNMLSQKFVDFIDDNIE